MDLGMFGQSELLKIISWTPWKTVGQLRIYYQKLYVACTYVINICVHMWVYMWYVWGGITVLLLYLQFLSIPVNFVALSWQFWEESGVLPLCYHEALYQSQLLHSVHSLIHARSPSSTWEPRAKLRSHSSCPPGQSLTQNGSSALAACLPEAMLPCFRTQTTKPHTQSKQTALICLVYVRILRRNLFHHNQKKERCL